MNKPLFVHWKCFVPWLAHTNSIVTLPYIQVEIFSPYTCIGSVMLPLRQARVFPHLARWQLLSLSILLLFHPSYYEQERDLSKDASWVVVQWINQWLSSSRTFGSRSNFTAASLKTDTVAWSKFVKRITSRELSKCCWKNWRLVANKISAHLSFGKPKIPLLMAGMATLLSWRVWQTNSEFQTAVRRSWASFFSPPSQTGPKKPTSHAFFTSQTYSNKSANDW